MANGEQELVYNASERAISDDQNRAQRFRGLDLNELLRALADTYCGTDDTQASSFDLQSTIATSPPSAAVFNGLVVRPQIGSLNLLVDPGVIGLYDPDVSINPDESQYKVIRDPGINIAGALAVPANTSGGTIIYVVECARVAGGFSVLETDNRDIFNPVTGLFLASTVNKVISGRLQYRVRAGGSGGGFPGTAVGWVPLAVISAPTGFTAITSSNCTLWDVRPFVGDRLFPPFNLATRDPHTRIHRTQIDTASSPTHALLTGYVDTSATDPNFVFLGTGGGCLYRLGGQLGGTTDLNLAANQSGAISAGVGYVYLLEPFGLPRWAIYTLQGGLLAPGNPRGIPSLSMTPASFLGAPNAPLALPPGTGLGGATQKAVCIAVGLTTSGAVAAVVTDGVKQTTNVPGAGGLFTKTLTTSGSFSSGTYAPVTDYPANAKALHLLLTVISGPVPSGFIDFLQLSVLVYESTLTHVLTRAEVIVDSLPNPTVSANALAVGYRVKVAIPPSGVLFGFGLQVDSTGSSRGVGSVNVAVMGWDL